MSVTEPHRYRVNEIFQSLQGEGFHTGRAAVFLRFSGCNRACAFCDTDHSGYTLLTADEIVERVSRFATRFLVATGGEPLLQLDGTLIAAIHNAGFIIAVETNGSLPVPEEIDWVTCSPKAKPWTIRRCDELKVVYTSATDVEEAAEWFDSNNRFIQPLFDAATGTTNVNDAIDYILEHPSWRLSLQTHRLLGIQ